eukprot:CAMPEP_0171184448 /NCGR_PEP_ID=MMETSP0790-20130122/15794_1 /TAXON_ID=2925 /ORGANISM="Alexandrium catenella, Strain OF101" /LENGTH=223 /DNA_ID=CAMNT_0011649445 /DNA_START=79 /DNA_END=746 /DNA_ORIENTATION=+
MCRQKCRAALTLTSGPPPMAASATASSGRNSGTAMIPGHPAGASGWEATLQCTPASVAAPHAAPSQLQARMHGLGLPRRASPLRVAQESSSGDGRCYASVKQRAARRCLPRAGARSPTRPCRPGMSAQMVCAAQPPATWTRSSQLHSSHQRRTAASWPALAPVDDLPLASLAEALLYRLSCGKLRVDCSAGLRQPAGEEEAGDCGDIGKWNATSRGRPVLEPK